MAAQKNIVENSSSFEIDFLSLSSDSSEAESSFKPSSSKKKPSSVKKKERKKALPNSIIIFEPKDMHNLWGIEQKRKFKVLKKRPVVLGRVIYLEQPKNLVAR